MHDSLVYIIKLTVTSQNGCVFEHRQRAQSPSSQDEARCPTLCSSCLLRIRTQATYPNMFQWRFNKSVSVVVGDTIYREKSSECGDTSMTMLVILSIERSLLSVVILV